MGTHFEPGHLVRNTHGMPLDPQHAEQFHELDRARSSKVSVRLVISSDLFRSLVAYPVLVEGWDKIKFGRMRRAWIAQFSKAERRTIARYYGRFYHWYLVSGSPRQVLCYTKTLRLLARAVAFFSVRI